MEHMDAKVIISLCALIITIVSFFLGQKAGISKNGYDQGVKDANIKNAIDNLAKKIEEYAKDSVRKEEFVRSEEKLKSLEDRYTTLEKRVSSVEKRGMI